MQPHPRFEFGVEVIDETGGGGAPPASFGDRVDDAMPLIDAVFRSHSDFLFSNKIAGVDALVRVPEFAGLVLYGEGAVDDFDARRLHSSLLDDGGYIAGLSLACLSECGRFGVRAEYHQTGIRFYTHDQFTSGVQDNGIMLGDPLGPRGLGSVSHGQRTIGSDRHVLAHRRVRSCEAATAMARRPTARATIFISFSVERRPGEARTRAWRRWTSGAAGARG